MSGNPEQFEDAPVDQWSDRLLSVRRQRVVIEADAGSQHNATVGNPTPLLYYQ